MTNYQSLDRTQKDIFGGKYKARLNQLYCYIKHHMYNKKADIKYIVLL